MDEETGEFYYYNPDTDESMWVSDYKARLDAVPTAEDKKKHPYQVEVVFFDRDHDRCNSMRCFIRLFRRVGESISTKNQNFRTTTTTTRMKLSGTLRHLSLSLLPPMMIQL